MSELKSRGTGGRIARHGEATRLAQTEVLLERAVGEPLLPTVVEPEDTSTLRPQLGRNAVWRWQMRRRRRGH